MHKMKKFLALILSVVMCASLFVPMASADGFSDVGADNKYYEAINYLASMGIINGFTDGTFKPEDSVTRAQFAKIMAFSLGYDDILPTQKIFTDVDTNHWAAGNIEAMVSLGIINGMGDGTFAPESPVLYEQAMKMAVCALGFGAIAENNGGYPDGYLKVGTQRGFIKNIVDGVVGQPAPRGLIAQLIDNMLDIDRIDEVTGEVKKDSSIKQDVYNSETVKGQVVAVYGYGLTEEYERDCKKDHIIIDDGKDEELYSIEELSETIQNKISSYLGKLVTVSYTDDDSNDYIIKSISEQKGKNGTVTIDANDISDYDGEMIEYYSEDSEDFEKIELANEFYLLYNGKATDKTFAEIMEMLSEGEGEIELLSTEDDDEYDVIFAKAYETFVVGANPATLTTDDDYITIYEKDNTANKFILPKESTKKETIKYSLNGSKGTYQSIKKDYVVSIAISDDSKVIDVKISNEKQTGATITAMSLSDDIITLDGKDFGISGAFKTYMENNPGIVAVTVKGDFYLDAFGKVSHFTISAGNYTYGYLSEIVEGSSRKQDPLLLNVYPVNSGTAITPVTYAFKSTFYVNGEKYRTSSDSDMEEVAELLRDDAELFVEDGVIKGTTIETTNHNESQPIKFSLSGTTENGYKAIDKLFTVSSAEPNETAFINAALVISTKGEALEAATSKATNASGGRNLGGYVVNSTSKVIVVPKDKENGKYYKRAYSWIANGSTYSYQVFDATTANVAGLVVIYESDSTTAASLTYQDTPYIVSKTGTTETVDGEETEVISLINAVTGAEKDYYKGDETEVYTVKLVDDEFVKDEDVDFESLEVGDAVRIIADESDSLGDVEIVTTRDDFDATETFIRGIRTGSSTAMSDDTDANYRTVIGTAKTWDEDMLVIAPAFVEEGELDGSSDETLTVSDSVKVYVVDPSQSRQDRQLQETTKGDIIAYDDSLADTDAASKILVFMQSANVKFIIIYK